MPTGTDAIVGVLSDRESTAKTVDQLIDPAKWDMTKLFTGLNITRGIISFAEFILIVLTGFLMIGFRLAVPWMIAMSLDKSLAHEVSYRFARGVVVYTLVFPIVMHILEIIAFKIGTLGMAIYDGTPMYDVDPVTAQLIARPDVDPTFCFGIAVFMMAVAALCLVAAPVLSWKTAFGQTFEGIATVASGWMAAIVGSGINFVSARVGASLNNMAERLQVETHAAAGLITARADYGATIKANAAGLHNQLGQVMKSACLKPMGSGIGAEPVAFLRKAMRRLLWQSCASKADNAGSALSRRSSSRLRLSGKLWTATSKSCRQNGAANTASDMRNGTQVKSPRSATG